MHQNIMKAIAIDRFGDTDTLKLRAMPVPEISATEVLIRVEIAGVGSWDATERRGEYDGIFGKSTFPYVLGWDGAGTIAALGKDVKDFKIGDRVYSASTPLPKGGFYAEYAAVAAEHVAHIPSKLTTEEAGVLPWVALTALSGLEELNLKKGETLMIFGASGGIGHLAVQLAKRMGVRVLAVAAGEDGVALVKRLGAEKAVDGFKEDVLAAAREFAPDGLDAALVTISGKAADEALTVLRTGSRVAYPNGVWPEPQVKTGIKVITFDGDRTQGALKRLNETIEAMSLTVHVAKLFPLEQAKEAHEMLKTHYIGKFGLRI